VGAAPIFGPCNSTPAIEGAWRESMHGASRRAFTRAPPRLGPPRRHVTPAPRCVPVETSPSTVWRRAAVARRGPRAGRAGAARPKAAAPSAPAPRIRPARGGWPGARARAHVVRCAPQNWIGGGAGWGDRFFSCFFCFVFLIPRPHGAAGAFGAAAGSAGTSGRDSSTESAGAKGFVSLTPDAPAPSGAPSGDTSPTVSRGALAAGAGPGECAVTRLSGSSGRAKT